MDRRVRIFSILNLETEEYDHNVFITEKSTYSPFPLAELENVALLFISAIDMLVPNEHGHRRMFVAKHKDIQIELHEK